jgi:hypothetical protein
MGVTDPGYSRGASKIPARSRPMPAPAIQMAEQGYAIEAQAANAMQWIAEKASHEWAQSCALDIKQQMERRNRRGQFAILIKDNPTLTKFFAECQELIAA